MGEVTKHIDGATYALKGCPIPENAEEIDLTLREAQTMAQFEKSCNNCTNVVRYYDVWIERMTPEMMDQFVDVPKMTPDGKLVVPPLILFIQLELCDLSLSQWLKNNSGSIEDIWDIFTQIVEGLSYIHEHGFIHRDIKPGNIFLKWRDDGGISAKLGDLGLAKFNENMRGYSSKVCVDLVVATKET